MMNQERELRTKEKQEYANYFAEDRYGDDLGLIDDDEGGDAFAPKIFRMLNDKEDDQVNSEEEKDWLTLKSDQKFTVY